MRGRVIVGVMTISTDVDKLYDTDLTDAAWALIAPMLPAARPGGRPRKINIRAVLNAIFYLLGVTTRKCANCPVREATAMLSRSAIRAEI